MYIDHNYILITPTTPAVGLVNTKVYTNIKHNININTLYILEKHKSPKTKEKTKTTEPRLRRNA